MEKVIVYSQGICAASICVDNTLTRKEIVEEMNKISPTGIESKWAISNEKNFHDGNSNPCPCDKHGKTRSHYLMVC